MRLSRHNEMTSGSNPRILCISPLFAPMADSEAFCSAKMVAALVKAGADVRVLSCSNVVRENPTRDASPAWQELEPLRMDLPTPTERSLWTSICTGVRYRTSMYSRWVARVSKQARILHQQRPFDLVYSRSLPMCAHIAGFWCAKTLGLPWVANLNDPWEGQFLPEVAFPNLSMLNSATYTFWLRRTLESADLITYPCERLHAFHARVSGIDHEAAIVPHVAQVSDAAAGNEHLFHLLHAGKLGASENPPRPVRPLLIALKNFLDAKVDARPCTRLTLVGPADEGTNKLIVELGLQDIVSNTGRVSYEQSLRWIAAATVCVLVEAVVDEGIFFPSKLVDYLSAGKPVLAMVPEKGTTADLAEAHSSVTKVGQHDPAPIQTTITDLYEEFKAGRLAFRAPIPSLRNQFTSAQVAGEFLAAVRTIMKSSGNSISNIAANAHLGEPVQLVSGVK